MDVHLRDFPHKLGTWRNKKSVEMDPDVIAVLGLDDWLVRHYEDGSGRGVQLYIGYLDSWSGKKRRKTVHSPQFCYAGAGWEILEKGVISLPVLERSTLPITRMLVRKGMSQQVVVYWYQWGGRASAEENAWDYGAKLVWMLKLPYHLARHDRTDRTLLRISSPVVGSPEATLQRTLEFVQVAFPSIAERFSLEVSGPLRDDSRIGQGSVQQ